jgi:type III pantothenate kinase
MVYNRLGLKAIIVNASLPLGITIHYESPNAVGADRICNAIAGFKKFGGPLIIVDFGTATTFDVISKDGDYLGGIIAPGVETSLQTLHYRAALLQKVELKFPDRVVGNNTETSMQSGLMYGTAELINGLLKSIRKELQCDFNVVATGGLAALITPKLNYSLHLEPQLTLYGLQIIHEKVS